MNPAISWPEEYTALIGRLPDLVDQSRLTVGGFSTCVDVYLSFHEAIGPLSASAHEHAEGAALLTELKRRALNGVGGEIFVDWPDGANWIDRHVTGRKAIGGTNAQAAYMLAQLGARALIALEDRSADQLAVLHPDSLVATESDVVPVSSLSPEGPGSAPHYIFEFTAGETIDGSPVPRSSRTIVRFDHNALHRDPAFVRISVENAADIGAAVLCGFNEIPPETSSEELDYAAGVGTAWRQAGLSVVHVELGDFPESDLQEATINRVLPAATSLGMSLSELTELTGETTRPEAAAIHFAETHSLERICIHADDWAFTASRGDAEGELEALKAGCLLASARAAAGYFSVPDRLPDGAQFRNPPLPPSQQRDGWSIVCCPAPYLEKPAATIGLGDTFLAGTLLVLGGSTTPTQVHARGERHASTTAPP